MNTCKTCKFWSRIYVHHVRDRITGEVFETFKPGTHDPLIWEEYKEEWDRGKCTGLEDRTDFVSVEADSLKQVQTLDAYTTNKNDR